MRRLAMLGLLLATPLMAQTVPKDAPPVAALPGAGRAIELEVYRARRTRLIERVGHGVIVVAAASRRNLEALVLQDNDFRQDDYFMYLTGLESPDAWLLLTAGPGGVTEMLFLPPTSPVRARWTGVQLGPGETAVRLTGIARVAVMTPEALEDAVAEAVSSGGGPLYTVVTRGGEVHPLLERWRSESDRLQNVRPTLDSMRVIKDEHGLAALRRAIAITGEGIRAGMRVVRPGMFEYQLEAVIEYRFRSFGADRMGFPSIVGSGPNNTVLHYDVNRREMRDGDLVVVDVGAEYAHYTADITRTFPVGGTFTDRQKAVYDLVLGAQGAVIQAIRPGITLGDLNRVARNYLAEHGDELCGADDCSRYLMHGVSHWLGMRVHDVGAGRMPLQPGMVLTVEPGVYLEKESLGIRIEDDVLVTEHGAEVLSAAVPKTTEAIEALMQARSAEPGNVGVPDGAR